MKRLEEKYIKPAKKKLDDLEHHANKPDRLKKSIYELGQDPKGRRLKMRTYPNMGKKETD
ncbi:MAG: hypothetical protein ACYST3_10060 [Planctomycetota bacterium]|jgi:hypothetical protein